MEELADSSLAQHPQSMRRSTLGSTNSMRQRQNSTISWAPLPAPRPKKTSALFSLFCCGPAVADSVEARLQSPEPHNTASPNSILCRSVLDAVPMVEEETDGDRTPESSATSVIAPVFRPNRPPRNKGVLSPYEKNTIQATNPNWASSGENETLAQGGTVASDWSPDPVAFTEAQAITTATQMESPKEFSHTVPPGYPPEIAEWMRADPTVAPLFSLQTTESPRTPVHPTRATMRAPRLTNEALATSSKGDKAAVEDSPSLRLVQSITNNSIATRSLTSQQAKTDEPCFALIPGAADEALRRPQAGPTVPASLASTAAMPQVETELEEMCGAARTSSPNSYRSLDVSKTKPDSFLPASQLAEDTEIFATDTLLTLVSLESLQHEAADKTAVSGVSPRIRRAPKVSIHSPKEHPLENQRQGSVSLPDGDSSLQWSRSSIAADLLISPEASSRAMTPMNDSWCPLPPIELTLQREVASPRPHSANGNVSLNLPTKLQSPRHLPEKDCEDGKRKVSPLNQSGKGLTSHLQPQSQHIPPILTPARSNSFTGQTRNSTENIGPGVSAVTPRVGKLPADGMPPLVSPGKTAALDRGKPGWVAPELDSSLDDSISLPPLVKPTAEKGKDAAPAEKRREATSGTTILPITTPMITPDPPEQRASGRSGRHLGAFVAIPTVPSPKVEERDHEKLNVPQNDGIWSAQQEAEMEALMETLRQEGEERKAKEKLTACPPPPRRGAKRVSEEFLRKVLNPT